MIYATPSIERYIKAKRESSQNWSICFFESGGLFHVNVCFYGLRAVRGWPASVLWSNGREIDQVIMAQHIALWSATLCAIANGWTCTPSNGITIRKWCVQLHNFHGKLNEGMCDSFMTVLAMAPILAVDSSKFLFSQQYNHFIIAKNTWVFSTETSRRSQRFNMNWYIQLHSLLSWISRPLTLSTHLVSMRIDLKLS